MGIVRTQSVLKMNTLGLDKETSPSDLERPVGHDYLAAMEICLNLSPKHVIKEFIDKWQRITESHKNTGAPPRNRSAKLHAEEIVAAY